MDGIDLMAAAMHAARTRLDVSASNLANASSAGFRRRVARATLTERGLVVATSLDRRQGPLERTGRAFDLAAVGGSLFVRNPRGAVIAERSASFSLDATGALVDERGRALLGERGLVRASSGATVDARGRHRDGGKRRIFYGTLRAQSIQRRKNSDLGREFCPDGIRHGRDLRLPGA